MANIKQMDIIKRGVDSWNSWRINNSHVLPSLSDAGLHMAYLKKANLSKADLSDAGLRLADLIEANLKGADLYWANLSEANLRGADLRQTNLQGANMTGSNLLGTKMHSANLSQANLSRAVIYSSELNKANLHGADLSGADLRNTSLKDANLIGANFTGANLEGADFTNAIIGATLFGNVDLSNVKGLESLVHLGPSTIGIDTIYKSRGRVPVQFLKNGGVPGHLIDYIELFVDQNEKHFSCLISYTEKNEAFALKLYEDLQAHGIRCWLAAEKLRRRDRKHGVISSAVNLHDKLIMVLSEDSINKVWAEKDHDKAIEKELRSRKKALIPISLDDAVKYSEKPWAVKMRRSRSMADFSMWEDSDVYQEMLSSLLQELTADEDSPLLEKIHEDEFDMEENISEAAVEADAMDQAWEFRADRRLFC